MKLKYPFLSAALLVLALVCGLLWFGVLSLSHGLVMIGLFQLAMFAMSRPQCALFLNGAISPEQAAEFKQILEGFKEYGELFPQLKEVPRTLEELEKRVSQIRRLGSLGSEQRGVRWIGNVPFVTDDCAQALTSMFVLGVNEIKALEQLQPDASTRELVLRTAKECMGVQTRTSMSGTEIPLPTVYAAQVIELVFAYGQARQFGTVFPLGAGTVKLPRLKAGEDDFGYLGVGTAGMSQTVPEKRVTAELATFTANKAGGIIRLPFELEQDTFIPIGQFLARYIARQLAKLEDKTMFLADGTSTYANQTGVGPYCATNTAYLLQLATGKTKPSDATLDDIRNLRSKVSGAVLGNMGANGQTNGAYYVHPTFEPFLRSWNKYPNFVVFEYVNGRPMFDGWPVRWIGVSQSYSTQAAPSSYVMFFGDLSYWYLGERGQPRVEVSKEVYFTTDELAMRALERIDVEPLAVDAMAALQTAAS